MAGEIRITANLQLVNGDVDVKHKNDSRSDQTTLGAVQRKQTIPTSDTVLALTGVTTARALSIENLDETNWVRVGSTSGGAIAPLIRLLPGEAAVMPLEPGTVVRAQANAASVIVSYMLVET